MSTTESTQVIDLSAALIDPADPVYQPLLEDLQGDILKPNARTYASYVVFQFREQRGPVRNWLASLAATYVTSAAEQLSEAAAYRERRVDGGLFGTLTLTAPAYEWLGVSQIPRDRQAHFITGMTHAGTQELLADPPVERWEAWSQQTIHAILSLFDDDRSALDAAVVAVTAGASGKADVLSVEQGSRWKNTAGQFVEPFGYADGISQPIFLTGDIPSNQSPGSYDPSAPLSLVLIRDPNGAGSHSHGSFAVYRKLQQDVAGFNKDVVALAARLGIDPALAGAYVVGRFKDGTPVVLSQTPTDGQPDNSFQFALDPDGTRCPFQAHIRKANPRGDTVRSNNSPLEVERSHRIVRRAFVFGTPGGDNVGLQFFCYQSDIGNQFEFIQSSWANTTHFLRMNTGCDGIIGQLPTNPGSGNPWPNAWGDASRGTTACDFARRVSLRGGAYLFAPSISFLRSLAG